MHFTEEVLRLSEKIETYCCVWSPDGDSCTPGAILLLHGVESHAEWFTEVAVNLCSNKTTVYAPDRPGWGKSNGKRGHLESYDDALNMLELITNKLRKKHSTIHLAGLSWGGKFALYATLRRPYLFNTLSLIAPGLKTKTNLGLWKKLRIAADIFSHNKTHGIELPIKATDFSSKPEKISWILSDNLRTKTVTASFCLESLKMDNYIEQHIEQLRIPTQLLLAENDLIIDNPATEQLFARCKAIPKRTLTHKNAYHSLVFETPKNTASQLTEWITKPQQKQNNCQKIVIMGAGAVGSTLGALLALGGHRVTLVCRQKHASAINQNGLNLTLGKSELNIKTENLKAITDPEETKEAPDLIIICVKGFDTQESLKQITPLVKPKTVLLSLQNGIYNEDKIAAEFPDNALVGGSICGYFSFTAPGKVALASDKGGIAIGPWNQNSSAIIEALSSTLKDSGLEVIKAESWQEVKWSKLLLNVAFNALNTLTDLGTAEIMENPGLSSIALETFSECVKIMQANNITPINLPAYPVARLTKVMGLPGVIARKIVAFSSRKESKGKSSMAQDFARGRGQSEISELNGVIISAGKICNIKTPVNIFLKQVITEVMNNNSLRQQYLDNPDLLTEMYAKA